MTYRVTVDIQRVGLAKKAIQPDPGKRSTILETETMPDGPALAGMLSAAARNVAPAAVKNIQLRIRITTPDGEPWINPCFFLEEKGTGARYGYGFVRVFNTETQEKEFISPWNQ